MSNRLTVYTHPECNYSDALKSELPGSGVEFEEIDLAIQPEKWHELEKLTGGDRITPVCVEGDSITVGFHGVG